MSLTMCMPYYMVLILTGRLASFIRIAKLNVHLTAGISFILYSAQNHEFKISPVVFLSKSPKTQLAIIILCMQYVHACSYIVCTIAMATANVTN